MGYRYSCNEMGTDPLKTERGESPLRTCSTCLQHREPEEKWRQQHRERFE